MYIPFDSEYSWSIYDLASSFHHISFSGDDSYHKPCLFCAFWVKQVHLNCGGWDLPFQKYIEDAGRSECRLGKPYIDGGTLALAGRKMQNPNEVWPASHVLVL
jgi:hypothetical protein